MILLVAAIVQIILLHLPLQVGLNTNPLGPIDPVFDSFHFVLRYHELVVLLYHRTVGVLRQACSGSLRTEQGEAICTLRHSLTHQ